MLIQRHWRFVHSSRPYARPRAEASGFTLIELLVVVAIIAVLISILLPSLSSAREQARMAVCGQHLRQFGNGLQTYVAENQDWLPGVNTTGVGLLSKRFLWGGDVGVLHNSKLPVQIFDWMTPIMCMGMELPAQRAERFKFLLDHFRCPTQAYDSVLYKDEFRGPDWNDFVSHAPWPGVSYLMSVHFQYCGQRQEDRVMGYYENQGMSIPIKAFVASPAWEVRVDDYVPILTRVGAPARKVFCADGTRFLPDDLLLDHDVSVDPNHFGSFASAGAFWSGSQAYGVKLGSLNWDSHPVVHPPNYPAAEGQALPLSYRHGRQRGVASGSALDNTGSMNAAFFDGHVERMSDKESRDAHLWYPKGAVVQQPQECMRTLPQDFVIP